MIAAPLPVYKGLFAELGTAKTVHAFFLKHDDNVGETEADDCFLTVSEKLDGGAHGAGESGLYPVETFKAEFKFICLPNPQKPFGSNPS